MISDMRTIVLAGVLALSGPLLAGGQVKKPAQAAKAPAVTASAVKELYGSLCQACHGVDGKAPIKEMGFVGRKWKTASLAASAKTIREGVPGTAMLPFEGRLTEQEIMALAKYVRSLDKKPAKK